jgi:GNAT superfamily N-acetyltransferase
MQYRLVDGADFACSASELLQRVWRPPALFYSPEYVKWQLSFPGTFTPPAVAAFEGSTLAGFAASTHRRVLYAAAVYHVLVVSFVGVDPDFRNRGIASGLYAFLLSAIAERGIPVITYAQKGSAGERAIERSYPGAGFALHAIGAFPLFGCVVRSETDAQGWATASAGEESAILRTLTNSNSGGNDRICSEPSAAQIEHYLRDPRGRRLLVQRHGGGDVTGAAWAVRAEHTSANGTHSVAAIDGAWLAPEQACTLPGLAAAVARLWNDAGSQQPVTVQASCLGGVDAQAARQVGFRQIATPFQGYVAVSSTPHPLCDARGSNLEVV